MSLRQLSIRSGHIRAASFVLKTSHTSRCGFRYSSTAPATIVDRSFWRNLVPKPLRKENRQLRKKSKEWNPATFFIAIFLLIGSMSIQMITLRNSFDRYMRQSEARIASLREVVEKIQRGETVDVETVLGTGDPAKEADWEESMSRIQPVHLLVANGFLQC
jgi:ATP adenylyltransferase/5',5'''-P-1,P-4-tetraphosphate phosphorylase II